jgi:phosphoglycolate phosphatase
MFDLDGTLTDPKLGITRCIQHALLRLGADVPHQDALEWCIGPPLRGSFARLLATEEEERVAQAMGFYRDRFADVGMFENQPYPGVLEMLQTLRDEGRDLFVATSKPAVFAKRILEHFELATYFRAVYGSELDGRLENKAELIGHLMEQEGVDPTTTCMVGDRMHDVVGSAAHDIPCIGVTYGYGSEQELREAGAWNLCASPGEVATILRTSGSPC